MKHAWCIAVALGAAIALFLPATSFAETRDGTVVDAATSAPIANAIVTLGSDAVVTDAQGKYSIAGGTVPLQVRAAGYRRESIATGDEAFRMIRLTPLAPKALYLTVYGIGAPFLRDPALEVIEKSGLNALVIDLKGDRGLIPYPSALPLAAKAGALKLRTIPDLKELAATLKARGIYLIARIVVFKDDLLVSVRPDWAVRVGSAVWKDREGLGWIDPFRKEAWDYTLGVAEEAAAAGFDEIQFDYVRFPDAAGPAYSQVSTETSRVEAITGFVREARRRLTPYNVFIALDTFGYVCWNRNDTGIGQRVEDLATVADYISPMLYPSGFQFGIPGYTNPIAHPYEIVHRSLEECKSRTAGTAVRYRPWLQAFPDYAFGGQKFGADEIGKQIKASRDAGTVGWMLWNPRNVYSTDDIKPQADNDKIPAKR
ncbi:MAG: putative glycoside hydrolase [Reyranella sp.]|nr:putative glycoside hydrolase [Reyranella sp.]